MSRQSSVPYIGSKISLVSNSEIRYEGILYTINTQESTIALQSVRCFGTEGRKVPEIPPSSEVYDFIIFRGQDIKDLTVLEAANSVNDPAIVSINQRPAGKGADAEKGAAGKAAPSKSAGQSISSMLGGNWTQQSALHAQGYGKGSGGKDYQAAGAGGWGGWSNNWKDSWSGGGWGGEGGWGRSGSSYGKGGGGGGGGGKGSGGASYSKGATSRGWNGDAGKSGKASGKSGERSSQGGKPGERGKGGKSSAKGGSGTFDGKGAGKRRRGGDKGNGAPVGELLPEDNAEAKREFAVDFDYSGANDKFDKIIATDDNLELEGVEERLKPLTGYDKSKSFFDCISCEATEHAANTDQKVDRDKARQFDRETFGDTRRPPRPTGARPGKGRQDMNHPPARIVAARWKSTPPAQL